MKKLKKFIYDIFISTTGSIIQVVLFSIVLPVIFILKEMTMKTTLDIFFSFKFLALVIWGFSVAIAFRLSVINYFNNTKLKIDVRGILDNQIELSQSVDDLQLINVIVNRYRAEKLYGGNELQEEWGKYKKLDDQHDKDKFILKHIQNEFNYVFSEIVQQNPKKSLQEIGNAIKSFYKLDESLIKELLKK